METNMALDQIRRSSYSYLISADCTILHILIGDQLRDEIHKWLSPPDPSTNHTIACDTHHKKTADWFFQGRIYQEWKSKPSLLWVHGKRSSCSTSNLVPSDGVFKFSWIRKERSLVRGTFAALVRGD